LHKTENGLFETQAFARREIVPRYAFKIYMFFWRCGAEMNAPVASKSTPYQ
jgi:hypothetical protein